MGMIGAQIDLKTLLTPQTFKRQKFSSHLYAPFSIKLQRRTYIYTHRGYDLWTQLESCPSVVRYNERVIPVPINCEDGRAATLSPDAASVDKNNQIDRKSTRLNSSQ